eukprot:scaffold80187_cov18-Tisochrysis_lutea.AAC.2
MLSFLPKAGGHGAVAPGPQPPPSPLALLLRLRCWGAASLECGVCMMSGLSGARKPSMLSLILLGDSALTW